MKGYRIACSYFASTARLAQTIFWTLALTLCLASVSLAQDTGYIGGTVTDKSGAAIGGADVTITNVTGNYTRSTTTNADGAYVLAGLPGANYDLSVTATGFQKYTANVPSSWTSLRKHASMSN